MRCKDCPVTPYYDYSEDVSICGLFGYDNDNEHFRDFANGDEGCIHRKSTILKWLQEEEYMCNLRGNKNADIYT